MRRVWNIETDADYLELAFGVWIVESNVNFVDLFIEILESEREQAREYVVDEKRENIVVTLHRSFDNGLTELFCLTKQIRYKLRNACIMQKMSNNTYNHTILTVTVLYRTNCSLYHRKAWNDSFWLWSPKEIQCLQYHFHSNE